MREVQTLAAGAYDDPDRSREFVIRLTTSNNSASYQITTELLPLTIYEACPQTDPVGSHLMSTCMTFAGGQWTALPL